MRLADPSALDDHRALGADGAATMLNLVQSTGRQLQEGYRAGRSAPGLPSGGLLRSIVVCGMGGSGVAGDILRALYAERLPVPIVPIKGYGLPEFCGRETLLVAVSYSGNTEETLSAYTEAIARGCRVVTVSAGGELARLARGDDVAHVRLPAHVPVPRGALGFLASAPMGVLESMELIPSPADEIERTAFLLEDLATALGPERPGGENEAKSLAAWIGHRIPVVWGSEGVADVAAMRWKTQVNENAKGPAFVSVLPELDHNEVEGWSAGSGTPFATIVLRHGGEHPKVGRRVVASLEAIAPAALDTREVLGKGFGPLESLFSLVMMGDFVSIYLGVLRGVDPLAIPVLSGLKERLRE